MTAAEFLNIVTYLMDKAEHDRQQIELWQKTH